MNMAEQASHWIIIKHCDMGFPQYILHKTVFTSNKKWISSNWCKKLHLISKASFFINADQSLLQKIQNCHSSLQDQKGIKIILLKMCFPALFCTDCAFESSSNVAYLLQIKEHGSLMAFSSEEYLNNYHRQRNKTQRIWYQNTND